MDPKLALLFLFVGTVIALSNIGSERARIMQRLSIRRQWRAFVLGRRRT
jgi:hypothetical protein